MADIQKKIEHFEKKITSIQDDLADMKKEVDSAKRQEKQKRITDDISDIQSDIQDKLDELKKDADTNKDVIAKLEDLKKSLEAFSGELTQLKQQIVDSKNKKDSSDTDSESKEKEEESEGTPSLFASVFYGGIVAKGLGSLPLIGDSLKKWGEKKVKESGKEKKEEKEDKDNKPGFFHKVWNVFIGSALVTGAFWLGKKVVPDSWKSGISTWWHGLWNTDHTQQNTPDSKDPQKESTSNTSQDSSNNKKEGDAHGTDDGPEHQENSDSKKEDVKEQPNEEEKKASEEATTLHNEGYSDLFILMRLYEKGFMPRVDFLSWKNSATTLKGRVSYWGDGAPLLKKFQQAGDVQGRMKEWVAATITCTHDQLKASKLEAIIRDPDIAKLYDQELAKLQKLQDDLRSGKISSLDDVRKSDVYKEYADGVSKKQFKTFDQKIEKRYLALDAVKEDVKKYDEHIKKLKADADIHLQALNKEAKDPAKRLEAQKKAKSVIKEYNQKIIEYEKRTAIRVRNLPPQELKLFSDRSLIGRITKANGGSEKFLANTKLGKLMLGVTVMSLVAGGVSPKELGWQAADLAAGIPPFAGGVYDLGCAITGNSLAGNLEVKDRLIRAGTGTVSLALDVLGLVTWSGGNWASLGFKVATKSLKGVKVAKTGIEVAQAANDIEKGAEVVTGVSKVVKGAKAAEQCIKLGMYGFLGYSLVDGFAIPVGTFLYSTVKEKTNDVKDKADPHSTF